MVHQIGVAPGDVLQTYEPVGQTPKQHASAFYRGPNCNFWPYAADYHRAGFIREFLLKGWLPNGRFVTKQTKITAFGSCFAQNIAKYLGAVGYDLSQNRDPEIYVSAISEGLVNVHALLQQFEWAFEGREPPAGLWHGYKAEEFGYDPEIRRRTREVFLQTEFFIITLGLSEVWYDEQTGGVFWRAVPTEHLDPSRHKFRVCSMAETKAAIERMYELIRRYSPAARVLFTLSPIPLAATFRPTGCITANSASKAILRAALDEFLRDNKQDVGERLFYWPSYEIVSELFPEPMLHDNRHPRQAVLNLIMQLFEATFCDTAATVEAVEAGFSALLIENIYDLATQHPRAFRAKGLLPQLEPGGIVDFAAGGLSDFALGDGWHAPEQWGVWSSAVEAELFLDLVEPARLELELVAFAPRTVGVIDGEPPTVIDGDHTVHVVAQSPGPVRLAVKCEALGTPQEAGLGEDARRIGVGLRRITAHPI